jgi:hypothetical protein
MIFLKKKGTDITQNHSKPIENPLKTDSKPIQNPTQYDNKIYNYNK